MNKVVKKWNSLSLIIRIIIGLVIGAVLGLIFPNLPVIPLLGNLFVGALRAIAPILVFVLVMSSIANSKGGMGKNMQVVIFLYLISTFISAVVAVFGSFIFPQSIVLAGVAEVTNTAPTGISEVMTNLLMNVVSNPIGSIVNGNYIGILAWAVIIGLALRAASPNTKQVLSDFSDAITKCVRWVIQCAPFGILGLVFSVVSENGLEIFIDYGKLIILLVACMLFVALVSNPIIVLLMTRKNPYPLVLTCLRESGITAFFTRSSAANIPVNMALCKKLGLNEDSYSVSIPLGATINMDGAAVTITVMTLAATNTLGIDVAIPAAIVLSLISAISACGASGVAGGSLLLIPLACSLFGISNEVAMQVVGIGFIIGVIQDSMETAINSSSDVLFTATAEYYNRRKAAKEA